MITVHTAERSWIGVGMSDLKPCPFCGGEAEVIFDGDGEISAVAVKCKDCGIMTTHYLDDARKAIEAWNSQADTEQRAENAHWTECEVFDNADYEIPQWQSARCSKCGKYHTTPYMYSFDKFQYCPNCGARMDGNK